MQLKLIFLSLFCVSFLITGCNKKDSKCQKEIWNIEFNTSNTPGICYYSYKDLISPKNGHLTFQNRNNFSVHLIIFNETEKGKVEYEADLDGGGILSYYNINPENEYSVGVRVFDGSGKDNVNVMVYSNYEIVPYILETEI